MKGITLIALVITIIVLLILAGVSIAALTNQNGILAKATEAKTKSEQVNAKEQRNLLALQAAMNIEKHEYTDSKGVTVTIPAECAVSEIEGENTVEDGLVIVDKNANEWVWIPCTVAEYAAADSGWANGGYSDKTWTDEQATTTGLTSVTTKGGYFISRYEAGIPEDMTNVYANTEGAEYIYQNNKRNIDTYTPVSKANVQAWNFISQPKSKSTAEKMLNNSTVKSYLVDSYAWNAVCRKIASKLGTSDTQKTITNSTKWGNYYNNTTTEYEKINTLFAVHTYTSGWTYATNYNKGTVNGAPKWTGSNRLELATGSSEDFKAYNVYDIAGNMWEWTTETSTTGQAVLRGGSFGHNASLYPAVYRSGYDGSDYCSVAVGFRATLYVK